jgi:hypothetical protein
MPSRKSRKSSVSRKSLKNRKTAKKHASRKNNKKSRKMHRGGFMAPVGDQSMSGPSQTSLAQGGQYLNLHKGQYGGGPAAYPTAVTDSVLTGPMIAAARTGPLDAAIAQTRGMQDGGRRNRNKRSRKMRGGKAPLSENSMLLPAGLEKQAALNYEWSAAKDPNYLAPK